MNDFREGSRRTMTKADIVESVYDRVGFSKKESSEIVELVFETMKKTLERGEKVKISGFGKFEVRDKKPRRGRNPQTGSEIEISARRVLSFKPSQVLKSILAGDPSPGDEEASVAPARAEGGPQVAAAPATFGVAAGNHAGFTGQAAPDED